MGLVIMYKSANLIIAYLAIALWSLLSITAAQTLFVSAIIDGERLVLSDGSRVELVGVDAIEKFVESEINRDMLRMGMDRESVTTKGGLSAAYVSTLVKDRLVKVSFQSDERLVPGEKSTAFLPALVSVLDRDGQMDFLLNKKIIREGYAFADPQMPASFKTQFIELQNRARDEQLGFWALEESPGISRFIEKVKPSEYSNPYSRCRSIKGCVWVSRGNPEIGYWQSAAGYRCPCSE